MRLFFAIELPPDVQAALGRMRGNPQSGGDYRWVDPSRLHLTLAFLGEQPEDRLGVLESVGMEVGAASTPAQLNLADVGEFGGKRKPRVLWVDIGGDRAALLTLQSNLDRALRHAGFALEDRPFSPHITLARRRETATGGPPPGWPPAISHASFEMRELTLMHSRLSPRGPTYTPVVTFALGG